MSGWMFNELQKKSREELFQIFHRNLTELNVCHSYVSEETGSMYKELENLSEKELIEHFNQNMLVIKSGHDSALMMGVLGISPGYVMMYQESVEKIKSFNHDGGDLHA